jgi:hypothetical protein
MIRQQLSGTVSAGGTSVLQVLGTSSVKSGYAVGVVFASLWCDAYCSFRFRSRDNDVDLSPAFDVGHAGSDEGGGLLFPVAPPNVPWFLGPLEDGLELVVTGLFASGTKSYSVSVNLVQYAPEWLGSHGDDVPEIP